MEDDGEAGKLLLDLLKDVEAQGRRDEDAVGVPGALLGLELGAAVAGADGDGEGVDAGLLDEVLNLGGLGVVAVLGRDLVLDAGEHAELAFDGDVVLLGVGEFHDLLGELDVLVVGQARAVDHDRGEAGLDAALAELEAVSVVEVEDDGDVEAEFFRVFDRALGHVAEHGLVGVLAGAGRDLEDDRALRLDAGRNDGLNLLHVVEVVGRDGVTALYRLLEELDGVY